MCFGRDEGGLSCIIDLNVLAILKEPFVCPVCYRRQAKTPPVRFYVTIAYYTVFDTLKVLCAPGAASLDKGNHRRRRGAVGCPSADDEE